MYLMHSELHCVLLERLLGCFECGCVYEQYVQVRSGDVQCSITMTACTVYTLGQLFLCVLH